MLCYYLLVMKWTHSSKFSCTFQFMSSQQQSKFFPFLHCFYCQIMVAVMDNKLKPIRGSARLPITVGMQSNAAKFSIKVCRSYLHIISTLQNFILHRIFSCTQTVLLLLICRREVTSLWRLTRIKWARNMDASLSTSCLKSVLVCSCTV
jgi:hypothetical protein